MSTPQPIPLLIRWGWLILFLLGFAAGTCFGYTACVLDWVRR